MELLTALEAYLIDSRQIDSLARRQAGMICRCIDDEKLRYEAHIIVLLVLAALQKGTPRADGEYLLTPLAPKTISFYADRYKLTNTVMPQWFEPVSGCSNYIAEQLSLFFDAPDRYSPVSGVEPEKKNDTWPLLVVGKGYTGFSRYWNSVKTLEERQLATRLKAHIDQPDVNSLKAALQEVFIGQSILSDNKRFHFRQVAAAALACRTRFLVLSGGPGTGKTSVVVQILRTLLRMYPQIRADRVVLCAPTGRAKARLGESIDYGLDGLMSRFSETANITDKTLRTMHRKTIHSLLGYRTDGSFKYNHDNRLSAQVVVVDEASMVDLNLFTALMEACSDECRLLLVGDMHQLPSVEAGAVLGDLTTIFSDHTSNASLLPETILWIDKVTCGIPSDGRETRLDIVLDTPDWILKAGRLADHEIVLTHSYRSSRAILELATTINRGEGKQALALVSVDATDQAASLDTTTGIEPIEQWIRKHLNSEMVENAYAIVGDMPDTGELSREFNAAVSSILFTSTILALVHEGPRGRKAINRLAGTILREKLGYPVGDRFFHGLPVILGSNHHDLYLYNGDIGIVLHTKNEGTMVCFPRGNRYHLVALDRLIDPEPAFALTVHKAQGSEFDSVLLVLPEKENPLLTRQIIYTGITRAKLQVRILGTESILRKAIENREQRVGGVRFEL